MPSSKGKPTDPKLRESIKEDVKNKTNKDGGGKGKWSAWKAAELSKEYEKKGGGYENEAGSKNEPNKGTPTPKSSAKKNKEEETNKEEVEEEEETPAKPKANTSAKKSKEPEEKTDNKKKATPKDKKKATQKDKKKAPMKLAYKGGIIRKPPVQKKEKPKVEGTRKSARVAEKRERDEDGDAGGDKKKSKK